MAKVNYGETTGIDYAAEEEGGFSGFVVARKDHHTWTYKNGKLLSGICIPGITLYKPLLTPSLAGPPGKDLAKGVGDSLTTPDPTVAAYTNDPGTDWGLVGLSAGAALLVVGAFWAGIHFAGKPERTRR
jgi:hypothetical protein